MAFESKNKKIDTSVPVGPIQQAYVTDMVGSKALQNALNKIKNIPINEDTKKYDRLLINASARSSEIQDLIQKATARLAENRLLRYLNIIDPTRGEIGPVGAVTLASSVFPGDVNDLKKTVSERYKNVIRKHQDPLLDPEGEITKRETPWHLIQQGRFADLDSDIAGHRYVRKEKPFHYFLNPLSKSGPFIELGDRWNRRMTAGIAEPESTNDRFFRTLVPLVGGYYGGEDAQQRLRRAAYKNKLYAEEATPEIKTAFDLGVFAARKQNNKHLKKL